MLKLSNYIVLQDDPSYFTFFFDTSRRLSCYLAPERFCTSHELNLHPTLPGECMDVSKGLTHAMDIFSLGCVLVELFTEGQIPFNYELLVKYKCVKGKKICVLLTSRFFFTSSSNFSLFI